MKKIPQDIIGDIAILKFKSHMPLIFKKYKARKFLKELKSIKVALEKKENIKGELRIAKLRYLAGEKRFETTHKENGCLFRFNVAETYFSPRLSNERKITAEEVAKMAKNNSKILILFAGVAPYPITIAKKLKEDKKEGVEIYSNELNEGANIYAETNARLNKVGNMITFVNGDANKLPQKLRGKKFDIILMPRPNIEDTFLDTALKLSKKGTSIFYHGFGYEKDVIYEIKRDAKDKVGKIAIRKAGDIAPFKYRWQASFKVK